MVQTYESPGVDVDMLSLEKTTPERPLGAVRPVRPMPIVPILLTGCTVALAGLLAWAMWDTYMVAPWTRDGTVRAYLVTEAPEVSGRIVSLPVTLTAGERFSAAPLNFRTSLSPVSG